jgi:DNA-binding CsgD family transcriptional regulator
MLNSKILAFIDAINSATTEKDIWEHSAAFFKDRGFDTVAYLDLKLGRNILRTNLPDWWLEHYVDQGYAEIDSFFDYAAHSSIPKADGWDFVHLRGELPGKQKQLVREVAEVGVISGFNTAPRALGSQGLACWAIYSEMKGVEFLKVWRESGEILNLAAHLAYNAMQAKAIISKTPQLSDIECQCVQQLASGLSPKEIALRISFKPEEVHYHLATARQKMASQKNEMPLADLLAKRVVGI